MLDVDVDNGWLDMATCDQVWVLYNGYNVLRELLLSLSLNITERGTW